MSAAFASPSFRSSFTIRSNASSTATSNRRPHRLSLVISMSSMDAGKRSAYMQRVREQLQASTAESADALWSLMQLEARDVATKEPFLASFMFSTVLNHSSLPDALAFHLANMLEGGTMPATQLLQLIKEVLSSDTSLRATLRSDLLAIMERDAACTRLIDGFLYYKGFHALTVHRIAHALWKAGRKQMALYLSAAVNRQLQVDIHPNARIGAGAFLDHATGIVIGETVVIGENVSILQHVTLGGSGISRGTRHPIIGDNVSIGAGVTVVGQVSVGDDALLGASTFVLEDVPRGATAVGVPARVLKKERNEQPRSTSTVGAQRAPSESGVAQMSAVAA